MTPLRTIDVSVIFDLSDKPEYWQKVVNEAARIDIESGMAGNEKPTSYSQGQAFLILFHEDGLDTLIRIAHEMGDHINGWSIDSTWEALGEIGERFTPQEEAA